ncbi:MAG TPA: 5-formyltetrahydrofolate cyclo-ligase [Rudaea sp.]|nr:5-formyltetrahydrofolate cyclo-ligase [Rudaea sp.]HSC11372.1 5-formyltetrahydrofolate cyclo-ligase [Rhodanobacteraceae bacterium]
MDVNDRGALREELRAQRTRLTPAQRIAAATGVAAILEQLPEFIVDQRVAGYWAVAGELPLHVAVGALASRDQRYYLPVLEQKRRLRFAPWRVGADVRANRYGIPEPQCEAADRLDPDALDLVLVPLLGFDRRGHRLGTGAGYYDRSFAFLQGQPRPARPVLVGIGYSFCERPLLPAEGWDIRMDFVATERELIDCTVAEH